MRLVFIGTAPFAVPALRALVAAHHEVALVVTQPDRPGHRLKLTPPAVKVAAQEAQLEVFQPPKVREPDSVARIDEARPELIVVVAYGQIIPRSILELAPRGVLNVHGSLLPRYRGAAPVAHALLNGERSTGVTIMQMDEQLDHGPILATRELEIGPREDAKSVTERLSLAGAELLVETIARLDELQPLEQDHAAATLAPKLAREDGELEWTLSADEIDRRVRAFQPWPGVTLPFEGRRAKVHRGRPAAGTGAPGRILRVEEEGVVVAAAAGAYRLEVIQMPGARPVPATSLVSA